MMVGARMKESKSNQPEIFKKWKVFDGAMKTPEGSFEWKLNTWYSHKKLEGQSVKGIACFDSIQDILKTYQDHWEILAQVECFNEYTDGSGKKFFESVMLSKAWHWPPENFRVFSLECAKLLLKNLKDPKELLALGIMAKLNEEVETANEIIGRCKILLNECKKLEAVTLSAEEVYGVYRRYWDVRNQLVKITPELAKYASLVWQRSAALIAKNGGSKEDLLNLSENFHNSLAPFNSK
jgi:hypothetical protein